LRLRRAVIDDTGFPKQGRMSVGVARQYCGALGKAGNCQIGVSVNAVTDEASCPIDWRLFIPEAWDEPGEFNLARRARAHLPEDVHHVEKWRLALGMLDELIGWGLAPPVIGADGGYGEITEFRRGLEDRRLDYVVQVKAATSAFVEHVHPVRPAYRGRGRPPARRYRDKPVSLRELALRAGAEQPVEVTWREGSRGAMTSRFLALRVRPANEQLRRRAHQTDTELPVRWLLVEWPQDAAEPVKYWLSKPARRHAARAARRPREHPLAHRARLPRAQRRARPRPLRGPLLARLASPRHARLPRPRLPHPRTPAPETRGGSLTLFQLVGELQRLLACWSGTCPTCRRRLPPTTTFLRGPP
jgi:DDE superfamily endonuclease